MPAIDTRLRYLARGRMWPEYLVDFRAVSGKVTGERSRIDFLGVTGIGKTFLTRELAYALGERVPEPGRERPLSEEWADVFRDLYEDHFRAMAKEPSWEVKHRTTSHLTHVIDLEQKILRFHRNQITFNGISVLRHRLKYFAGLAKTDPEKVANLFSDRLVVLCTAEDAVERSLAGKKKRRDSNAQDENIRDYVANQVDRIHSGVTTIESAGVPVLEVNLDRPVLDSIAQIARFMGSWGLQSRQIDRYAAKA